MNQSGRTGKNGRHIKPHLPIRPAPSRGKYLIIISPGRYQAARRTGDSDALRPGLPGLTHGPPPQAHDPAGGPADITGVTLRPLPPQGRDPADCPADTTGVTLRPPPPQAHDPADGPADTTGVTLRPPPPQGHDPADCPADTTGVTLRPPPPQGHDPADRRVPVHSVCRLGPSDCTSPPIESDGRPGAIYGAIRLPAGRSRS